MSSNARVNNFTLNLGTTFILEIYGFFSFSSSHVLVLSFCYPLLLGSYAIYHNMCVFPNMTITKTIRLQLYLRRLRFQIIIRKYILSI